MTPLLSISHVSKSFGAVRSLDDINLDVASSGVLGLIGPNGAGKSTLVNVVSGAYSLETGSLSFGGHDLKRTSTAHRARLGLVRTFQKPTPVHDISSMESVTIGGLTAGMSMTKARQEALRIMGMLGLGEIAGQEARTLTTGQLKLVDLARVLLLQPKLVLLDELMSGLSKEESDVALAAIEELVSRGISFVVIEHLMDVVRRLSHHLAVMDAGRLIATGDFETLMRDPRVIEAYLGQEAGESHARSNRPDHRL